MTTDYDVLTDADYQQIAEEVAEEVTQESHDRIMSAAKQSIGLLGNAKPAQRYQGFLSLSYAPDAKQLLETDYAERRERGEEMPPLMSETMQAAFAESLLAQEQWLAAGGDPAMLPPMEAPLDFWARCYQLPFGSEVALVFVRDFRRVAKTVREREAQQQPEPAAY